MAKKHWMQINIIKSSQNEDEKTAKLMRDVAESLRKCGSRTIFDMAWSSYNRLCEKDRKNGNDWKRRSTPEINEFVEWRDENGKGGLNILGLAKCKRIQCPLCCFSRSFLRRNNTLDWAKGIITS